MHWTTKRFWSALTTIHDGGMIYEKKIHSCSPWKTGKMVTTMSNPYEFTIAMAIGEVVTSEADERLFKLRLGALGELNGRLRAYEKLGYIAELVNPIAEKKCALILKATSKAEMDKILKPRCPHYDGSKFVSDEYNIPEEELICWSQTSLQAPLNQIGHERYISLFRYIFPGVLEKTLPPHLLARMGGVKQ